MMHFNDYFFSFLSLIKGIVKLGYLDADNHKSLAGEYGIQGFPTVKIFASNKQRPEDYNGLYLFFFSFFFPPQGKQILIFLVVGGDV